MRIVKSWIAKWNLRAKIDISIQAIQDITRIYDDPPEEIVTLIYERIDVNNEGMTQLKMLYAVRDLNISH